MPVLDVDLGILMRMITRMVMRMMLMTMEMINMRVSLILMLMMMMMMMPAGGEEGKRKLPKELRDEVVIGGNHTHLRNSQECH